ncbi:dipeptide epimerase [uncultured Sphingosinicella sp.]|jgi:L-Ala-D/L-Glu epimerase|uniref:dipeptide epimerase n=1 Tax=uncultured Sphingosinicella sp. TaxID=478748 RepID=UPI0030D9D407|tara:strand:+ start:58340 stop:59350 length:1011 start_codon:yes stop_codon:yes gene_type:complete
MSVAGKLSLEVTVESLPLAKPFRISGHVFTHSDLVVVTLSDGVHSGRGEASGVYYLDDNVPEMLQAIEAVRPEIERGIDRAGLQTLMPAGGARNALDCAFWELEAKQTGRSVWDIAGFETSRPLLTTMTLGADSPEVMAEGAKVGYAQARALKLKLTGDLEDDIARVRAVRAARPDCWIGVDANQGYGIADLPALVEVLVEADVKLLEQPLRRGAEADLDGFSCPIPIAADESVLTLADVPGLVGRFNVVNIKLDKCGGLTEGLAMARKARELGLGVMVGNMVSTSLAMAPAYVVGQLCDVVDLDGPIFLAKDREPSIVYEDGYVRCPDNVWGRDA